MISLSRERKGGIYALCSGLCCGFIGYLGFSLINSGLSIPNMLFWRFLLATSFLLIILIPKYKIFFNACKKESLKMLIYGMIFHSTSTIIYFISSKYIGTGLAMVVSFCYPMIVMLLNVILYKVPVTKVYYLVFFVLLLGMVLLVDMQEFNFDILGIIFGILSATLYAFYMVGSKKIIIPSIVSTLMVLIGCTLTCLLFSCYDASFCMPEGISNWCYLICAALISTILPILLLLKSLKYITPEKASILSVLEPVFVVILGVFLLEENISILQILGSVLILSGSIVAFLN